MSIQANKFLIVLIVMFFGGKSFCQVSVANAFKNRTFHRLNSIDSLHVSSRFSFALQQDHYAKNLAFFCRQELKLEKAVRIPIRFRMGSLQQCNYLEGK